jgi:hypothetical protein
MQPKAGQNSPRETEDPFLVFAAKEMTPDGVGWIFRASSYWAVPFMITPRAIRSAPSR